MAFGTPAVLNAVVAMVAALPGMQAAILGVPLTVPARVFAYVTLGRQVVADKTTGGFLQKEGRIRVTFGYRVSGDVATAEADMAAAIDAFHASFYTARRTNLGGTVASLKELDDSAAAAAEYEIVRAEEFRRYPVDIVFTQQANY